MSLWLLGSAVGSADSSCCPGCPCLGAAARPCEACAHGACPASPACTGCTAPGWALPASVCSACGASFDGAAAASAHSGWAAAATGELPLRCCLARRLSAAEWGSACVAAARLAPAALAAAGCAIACTTVPPRRAAQLHTQHSTARRALRAPEARGCGRMAGQAGQATAQVLAETQLLRGHSQAACTWAVWRLSQALPAQGIRQPAQRVARPPRGRQVPSRAGRSCGCRRGV